MKKILPALCSLALLGSFAAIPQTDVQAQQQTDPNEMVETIAEQQWKYFQVSGKIKSIEKRENGFFATVDSEENPFGFYYDEDTLIFDNAGNPVELKEGMDIAAYIDGTKLRIMIYPPQYSPDVIIVQTKNPGTVQLDRFDENYLNLSKDLKIHLNDKSEIINLSGSKLAKKDVVNKEVLIFYEVVLESYPAQTGPSKVIVLERDEDKKNDDIEKAYQIAAQDWHIVNNVKMVPLRLIAEQLGYQVDSTGVGAIVSKGDASFTITRGTKTYIHNGTTKQFDEAPALLEPRKTYVPYAFIEELVGNY